MEPDVNPDDERPTWARRVRAERLARDWSQADAVRALASHGGGKLPDRDGLLRNWKRWEAGESEPSDFYKTLIAKTFGTVTAAVFPRPGRHDADSELIADAGMDTLELVTRLRTSDVSPAMFDALRITADRLCSEYSYLPSEQLHAEGQSWLRRITALLDRRLTLAQHREVLTLAGWVTLLVGCLEYDMGVRRAAEATRSAAHLLGEESGNPDIIGWAHEMRAWYALTQGNMRAAIAAADAGLAAAGPQHSVSVQLAAHRAKAWARIGDCRQVEVSLEQGRELLEHLSPLDNLDNHFVIDPSKFDFYTMDCYRHVGEDRLAATYARAVLDSSIDHDGTEIKPMRVTEARITLGVVAAREGDLELALDQGRRALTGDRKSLPSLLMHGRELAEVLRERYPADPRAAEYDQELRALARR